MTDQADRWFGEEPVTPGSSTGSRVRCCAWAHRLRKSSARPSGISPGPGRRIFLVIRMPGSDLEPNGSLPGDAMRANSAPSFHGTIPAPGLY
jgi:hypothetical protein